MNKTTPTMYNITRLNDPIFPDKTKKDDNKDKKDISTIKNNEYVNPNEFEDEYELRRICFYYLIRTYVVLFMFMLIYFAALYTSTGTIYIEEQPYFTTVILNMIF